MIDKRCAVLVNFTANTYHWGCYGTSMEIYQTLNDLGYYVNWLSNRDVWGLYPSPLLLNNYDDCDFANRVFKGNRTLHTALIEADVIIVNGEGTLHHLDAGPRNLLYLMYAARRYLDKPVHLINHSCHPTGGDPLSEPALSLYGGVLRTLNLVVPRETHSAAILRDLGVTARQGFDCLPRFIDRHGIAAESAEEGPLLLSGGIAMPEAAAHRIASVVARFVRPGQKVRFLSGAKAFPASEDNMHIARMREALPELEVVVARSMSEWLDEINRAACVISGRFHHTLAAATLRTPVITFPSNTPKIDAVCGMLGLDAPIAYDEPNFEGILELRLQELSNGRAGCVSAAARNEMVALAGQNFAGLDAS